MYYDALVALPVTCLERNEKNNQTHPHGSLR
jgi:hypothetical protein